MTMRISRSVDRLRIVSAIAASKIAAVAASGTVTRTSVPVKLARSDARPRLSIASTAMRTGSGAATVGGRASASDRASGSGWLKRFARLRRKRRRDAATAGFLDVDVGVSRVDLEPISPPFCHRHWGYDRAIGFARYRRQRHGRAAAKAH